MERSQLLLLGLLLLLLLLLGAGKLFSKIEKRRVPPHSEIIVGDEPPFIFWNHPVEEGGGVTPHSEILVGKSYVWSR